ncbi:MAG: hypothetical protein MJ252_17095 [archaeon]|nr:hypothetical protein [archaeon]
MHRGNLLGSTCNYNRSITVLREKVSQDLYLKTSIYNINNRKPKYGLNQNLYMEWSGKKIRNQSPQRGSKCTSINTSNNTSKTNCFSQPRKSPNRGNRYGLKSRKETFLEGLMNQKREQQKAIDNENRLLFGRIKRISSPYSKSRLLSENKKNLKMVQMRRQVRTNNQLRSQERLVKSELPKIYVRNKGM